MKTTGAIALFLALCLAPGCADLFGGKGIEGSGVAATEERAVTPFDSLDVRGAFTVAVRCGTAQSVILTGDDNLLPHVTFEVRGSRLVVDTDAKVSPRTAFKLDIGVESLVAVEGSGAVDMTIAGLDTEHFNAEFNGVGDLRASGRAGKMDAVLNGTGNLDCMELITGMTSVTINGAGDAELHCTEKLHAEINGTGSVTYLGNPEITQSISGIGSLRKR